MYTISKHYYTFFKIGTSLLVRAAIEEEDYDKVKWVQRRKQVRQMVTRNHPRLKFVFFVYPF